jgi:hypothetical protein
MEASLSLYSDALVQNLGGSLPALPSYQLVLEDIDKLVKVLFQRANVNPAFHLQRLSEDARTFLSRHNRHPLVDAA